MNFHLVVGQLESEPIIPKGSETDVQLRIATKELNVKSGKTYSTYHSVRVVGGIEYKLHLLKKGSLVGVLGNQQYFTTKEVEVPKGYSYPIIRTLPINCFVLQDGEFIQLSN